MRMVAAFFGRINEHRMVGRHPTPRVFAWSDHFDRDFVNPMSAKLEPDYIGDPAENRFAYSINNSIARKPEGWCNPEWHPADVNVFARPLVYYIPGYTFSIGGDVEMREMKKCEGLAKAYDTSLGIEEMCRIGCGGGGINVNVTYAPTSGLHAGCAGNGGWWCLHTDETRVWRMYVLRVYGSNMRAMIGPQLSSRNVVSTEAYMWCWILSHRNMLFIPVKRRYIVLNAKDAEEVDWIRVTVRYYNWPYT